MGSFEKEKLGKSDHFFSCLLRRDALNLLLKKNYF